MKIAIIGSGIAGLTTAHLLHQRHEITLYEAESRLGGHTATRDVQVDGQNYAVDTGFIVFNDRTYPNFQRLLHQLGIDYQHTAMSFAVRCADTGLEYCGSNLNTLFAQRRNLVNWRFQRMLAEILRFNRAVVRDFDSGRIPPGQTLGRYLEANGYSEYFQRYYILAMVSAIWSASLRSVAEFPMPLFVQFFSNHGLLDLRERPQWFSIPGGARRYVAAITRPYAHRIRLATPVTQVQRHADGVTVRDAHGGEQHFDYVVLASHSDQALAMLADPSPAEREILGALPYEDNRVILHTDSSLLPHSPRAWASWNYLADASSQRAATLTYNMNCLQNIQAPTTFCVTLNDAGRIAEEKILGQWIYSHPVYDPAGAAARQRRHEINGINRTFYCGAYWYNGFHEDGVNSALDIGAYFGVNL